MCIDNRDGIGDTFAEPDFPGTTIVLLNQAAGENCGQVFRYAIVTPGRLEGLAAQVKVGLAAAPDKAAAIDPGDGKIDET